MLPLLREGDVVFLKKIVNGVIRVDDIVCFRRGSRLVTHRVIYKKKNYVITKGDNNIHADGKIAVTRILGKVDLIKRDNQKISTDALYLFQSSIYFDEIKKILCVFKEKKINYVILKGLPLHLFLEKKHPRRIYADCDILVAKKDRLRATRLMRNEGYHQMDFSLSKGHKKLKNKVVEVSYGKEVGGFMVTFDIHYEAAFLMTQLGSLDYLYPQKLIDGFTTHLLDNKRVVMIENEEFPLLSLEDQIIYLFLHLFHHNLKSAYRYNILNTILQTRYDKDELLRTIKNYKLMNFIYSALALLQKYYPHSEYKELMGKLEVTRSVERYVKRKIIPIKIFDDDERIGGGVKRFLLIFFLSPRPYILRVLTVFNKQVIHSLYWVVMKRIEQTILRKFPFSRGLLKVKYLQTR